MSFKFGSLDNDAAAGLLIKHDQQRGRRKSLWIVAGCLAISSFCRAEADSFKLLPALTPLLILSQRAWRVADRGQNASILARVATRLWEAALVAAFAILTLSDWNWRGLGFSGVATGTSFIVYAAFLHGTEQKSFLPTLPSFESCVVSLSPITTTVLLVGLFVRVSIFGFPQSNAWHVLFLGNAKALAWRFTAQSARHTSWNIATMLATFGLLSTRNPFNMPTERQALSNAMSALLCLGQIIGSLPRQARLRFVIWAFALLPLVPYLANIVTIRMALRAAPTFSQHMPHPVEALSDRAKIDFQNLLQRQSLSFEAARDEYRSRYGIEPPPGFEEWYEFARSNDSPIIDDFDSIHQAISPFRKLSGKQILDTMSSAQKIPGIDLWLCQFSSSTSTTECRHPHRTFDRHISLLFNNLLKNVTNLGDVRFLVNHIDEPRVLFQVSEDASVPHNRRVKVEDHSRKPTWDLLTENCHHATVTEEPNDIETFGLPFVTNFSWAQNLCRHPEYSTMHGLLTSPVSFRLIKGAVPVLSTGALSSMGDILFPSPAYTETEFLYDESKDMEWSKKRDNLYWVGSTTGGFAVDANWRHFHRQRFVQLGQNLGKKNYYLRLRDGAIQRVKSSFLNGRLFNVVFTRVFQCLRKHCRDQDAYFNIKAWADKDEALGSKLVFDIDGNGISGRYYKLLASRSVPLKQTLLREWHDERLVPWMHYIPVSLSMDELPELIFYLTSTESGRQIAREIAEHGREWYSRAFREVDLGIYTYRLLLELARLQDPQREADLAT
ncbi:hypothetical protein FDECE_6166 [Fusarium decemcellulare]|nr:hypothetical protein FDECE_6166 [Fusarium decemcellulare]